jgi:hypothetical protein
MRIVFIIFGQKVEEIKKLIFIINIRQIGVMVILYGLRYGLRKLQT